MYAHRSQTHAHVRALHACAASVLRQRSAEGADFTELLSRSKQLIHVGLQCLAPSQSRPMGAGSRPICFPSRVYLHGFIVTRRVADATGEFGGMPNLDQLYQILKAPLLLGGDVRRWLFLFPTVRDLPAPAWVLSREPWPPPTSHTFTGIGGSGAKPTAIVNGCGFWIFICRPCDELWMRYT